MKSALEITNIIAQGIAKTVSGMKEYNDYNIIISTERIFLDDYAPTVENYIKTLNSIDPEQQGYEKPIEMPYQHTIFFIVKIGSGQVNFAIWNTPITIQCLSEENDFKAAEAIMKKYIQTVNFEYLNGIIQSYFVPEIQNEMSEVYSGFRALLSAKGYLRVPEDGVVFAQDIYVYSDDETPVPFKLPFLSIDFNHSSSPDPQAFSGQKGSTMSLNRTTTQSISITCYLFNYPNAEEGTAEKYLSVFSNNVIQSMNNMNRKFHMVVRSNIENPEEHDDNLSDYVPIFDFWYILTNAHLAQDWGDPNAWNITFTRAREID